MQYEKFYANLGHVPDFKFKYQTKLFIYEIHNMGTRMVSIPFGYVF